MLSMGRLGLYGFMYSASIFALSAGPGVPYLSLRLAMISLALIFPDHPLAATPPDLKSSGTAMSNAAMTARSTFCSELWTSLLAVHTVLACSMVARSASCGNVWWEPGYGKQSIHGVSSIKAYCWTLRIFPAYPFRVDW